MSGALLEIRKKIASVKNTGKITKAMQLVAASKMRQFQKRAVSARHYVWDLIALLETIIHLPTLYTEKRDKGPFLFILYTSDKGLCGPLNNKLVHALFQSELWRALSESERRLITIGKKGYDFARSNRIPVEAHFIGVSEKMDTVQSLKLVDKILDFWRKVEVRQVILIAPYYKNAFTFYPILKTFLPFSEEMVESNIGHAEKVHRRSAKTQAPMIYEPSQEIVVKRLHEQVVTALFFESFLELKASEYSSRMIAMQNATDAGNKITAQLSLDYNKARQQAITSEISELMGASEAMAS